MTHYICLICGGVSSKPGVCQTDHCEHKGLELVPCECDKKEHLDKISFAKEKNITKNK